MKTEARYFWLRAHASLRGMLGGMGCLSPLEATAQTDRRGDAEQCERARFRHLLNRKFPNESEMIRRTASLDVYKRSGGREFSGLIKGKREAPETGQRDKTAAAQRDDTVRIGPGEIVVHACSGAVQILKEAV